MLVPQVKPLSHDEMKSLQDRAELGLEKRGIKTVIEQVKKNGEKALDSFDKSKQDTSPMSTEESNRLLQVFKDASKKSCQGVGLVATKKTGAVTQEDLDVIKQLQRSV